MPRIAKTLPRGGFIDELVGVETQRSFRPTATYGTGNASIFGGYVQSLEDQSEISGRSRYEVFSEHIANVPVLAASVRILLQLASKPCWKFEPADESPEAERYAMAVEEIADEMTTPFERVVKKQATAALYGFALGEITMRRREDGTMGILDIESRSQRHTERWWVDITGTVHGVTQMSPLDFQERFIPRPKVWYTVDDSLDDDNPEGLGLLRHTVEPCRRVLRYKQLEGIGFDTDLRGVPITRVPSAHLALRAGLSKEKIRSLTASMRNFAKQHTRSSSTGLTLDSAVYSATDNQRPSQVRLWDVDILKAPSPGLEAQNQAIMRVHHEIAAIFGTESILLGSTSMGSHALADDKSDRLAQLVDGLLSMLSSSFRNDVLGLVFSANGWDPKLRPKIRIDKLQWRSLTELAAMLRDLSASGATILPTDPVVADMYQIAGLTMAPTDEIETDAALAREPRTAAPTDQDTDPEGELEE